MLRRSWCLLLSVAVVAPAARADVTVHPIFSDNMVLQRDKEVVVWGTADDNETVEVALKGNGTGSETKPIEAAGGKWKVTLPAQKAGTGYTLTVKGKNTVEFTNVAVGDVWLCSGQSNMEWKLSQLNKEDKAKGTTATQGKDVAAKAENDMIRLFTVPNKPSFTPQSTIATNDREGKWLVCKPETVINFSAVGYFFGRDIQATQKVPVGLISADWGGTICEAWTSKEALAAVPELKYFTEVLEKQAEASEQPKGPNIPTVLFNGMINPITQFKIKGALWYQGESNAGRAAEYYTLFPTMIQDWRTRWGYDFPFFVVQLAPFRDNGSENARYAEVRDAQFQASKKLKNVGYATLSDIGNETDIHPQAKEPVGQRLALAARAIAYGEKVEWSGPVYKGMKVEEHKVVLSFDHVGQGLVSKGDKLTGFTVAGEDMKFVPAEAKIVGDTVVLTTEVHEPVAVRYGWVNFAKPELNFFNKDGLPAVPFRTDDFPLTTEKK